MGKRRRFFLENFQLKVFTFTYILSVIFIFWLLSFFLIKFSAITLVISAILYLILATIIWAYLNVLFSIPQKLAERFDPLKNDISSGIISNVDNFSQKICSFIVDFYNYSFFDISYSAMKIGDNKVVFSSEKIKESMDWEKMGKDIIKSENPIAHPKIKIENRSYYPYSLPVFFGEQFLGFFTVFSVNRLGKQRLKLLVDLENFYLDDQLVHVINMERKGRL